MEKISVYIGSDNKTRCLNQAYISAVLAWANQVFSNGYTLIKGQGYYQGNAEETLILEAITNTETPNLKQSIETLKQTLQQEAILLTRTSVLMDVL